MEDAEKKSDYYLDARTSFPKKVSLTRFNYLRHPIQGVSRAGFSCLRLGILVRRETPIMGARTTAAAALPTAQIEVY